MSGAFLPVSVFRAVDQNGAPMAGAMLQFYVTGTTTPANVYTDKTLATPLSNPVVADSGGLFVPIYTDPTVTYRVQLQTSVGAVVRDIDPVAGPLILASNSVTSAMLQSGAALSNLGYTPVNKAGDTATNLLLNTTLVQANSAGFLVTPVNEQDGSYTLLLSDTGKLVRGYITAGAAYTIPPNTFLLGTTILIRNAANSSASITVTRGSGVSLYGAGGSTSKDWSLAAGGLCSIIAETTNTWVVAGTGLS
jgi:hypothetical protein